MVRGTFPVFASGTPPDRFHPWRNAMNMSSKSPAGAAVPVYRVWDSRRPSLHTPITTDFCTFATNAASVRPA
jgi:hypothetical protein